MDELINLEYLFEVSRFRSDLLKDIDEVFARIKRDKNNVQAKKDLVSLLKEFTNVKHMVLSVKKDLLNAAVVPIYNRQLSLDIIDLFRDYKPSEDKKVETIEEPEKYIRKIYIVLGDKLINLLTPRELTAIFLHELGHVYAHTANLPRMIVSILKKITAASIPVRIGAGIFFHAVIGMPILITVMLISFFLSRSMTFIEHRGEYKADQFAVKYGYGDELIKVLYKIHNIETNEQKNIHWLKKLLNFFIEIFVYPSSHPDTPKRIIKISEDLEEEYKQMYPKLSKEIGIILSDIKSEA